MENDICKKRKIKTKIKWCDAKDKCDPRNMTEFCACAYAWEKMRWRQPTKYDTFAVDKKTNQ